MNKFKNVETKLVSKWLGDEIDIILNDTETNDELELISILSEKIENKIKNDLQSITEGYVSEIIHISFENIDYNELIDYYKN
ncbi:hypothetical protein LG329_04635 [Virgibacillus necropolis]|uniref:hypothetical protein n=1 Tax=Virgibacillus necropolis TaxID=163877 RepID=UPI0038507B87